MSAAARHLVGGAMSRAAAAEISGELRTAGHVISFSEACRALKEKIQIDGGRACRLAPRTVHQWFQAPASSERHPATITYSKLSSNGFLGPELHRFYCSDFMKPPGGHLYWNPYCNGLGEM